MGVYIKKVGENIYLAGTVATEKMIEDGYFEYHQEIPAGVPQEFLRMDVDGVLFEDVVTRTGVELSKIREKRTKLLAESDWIVTKSSEQGVPVPEAWATYRQALRDITKDYTAGKVIDWPVIPS